MIATLTVDEEIMALQRRDPALLADPYPLYHHLRAEAPAHRQGEGTGTWTLTRYVAVAAVLRDPRFSADRNFTGREYVARRAPRVARLAESPRSQFIELQRLDAASMLSTDPPDHTRLRRLAHQAFT